MDTDMFQNIEDIAKDLESLWSRDVPEIEPLYRYLFICKKKPFNKLYATNLNIVNYK